MYRRDIFYSGSMLHVPEFKSQPNITPAQYTRSVTAIPVVDTYPPEEKYTTCGCIPVSKTFYNTMKQVSFDDYYHIISVSLHFSALRRSLVKLRPLVGLVFRKVCQNETGQALFRGRPPTPSDFSAAFRR